MPLLRKLSLTMMLSAVLVVAITGAVLFGGGDPESTASNRPKGKQVPYQYHRFLHFVAEQIWLETYFGQPTSNPHTLKFCGEIDDADKPEQGQDGFLPPPKPAKTGPVYWRHSCSPVVVIVYERRDSGRESAFFSVRALKIEKWREFFDKLSTALKIGSIEKYLPDERAQVEIDGDYRRWVELRSDGSIRKKLDRKIKGRRPLAIKGRVNSDGKLIYWSILNEIDAAGLLVSKLKTAEKGTIVEGSFAPIASENLFAD